MKLQTIRDSKIAKGLALVLAFELVAEFFVPLQAYALTTGPTQPEMSSFEPVGTSEMVNVFSGDFTYNIPLLDAGGYPINISYNSGISTDQEASWVGLGWNINPGAVTRSMRGVPDDFSGDVVTKKFNMKPNRTYGASVTGSAELFGLEALNLSYGVTANYNNYRGVGFQQSLNMTFTSGDPGKGQLTAGLGVTAGSDGANLNPSLSFAQTVDKTDNKHNKLTGRIGLAINSRAGLQQLSLNADFSSKALSTNKTANAKLEKNKNGSDGQHTSTSALNGGSSISFASPTYTPQVNMPMTNTSVNLSFKTGTTFFGADGTIALSGFYSEQRLERTSQDFYAYGYLNTHNGSHDPYAMLDFNREKDGAFTDNTPSLPLTNFSYDVYSVAGQGIGGMYRPYRSDLGYVYDPANGTTSLSGSGGFEIGVGNLAHGGADVSFTGVTTNSGRWLSDNDATALAFKGTVSGNPLYEPAYFKEAGEKSVDSDPDLFDDIGGDKPVRVRLQHQTGSLEVKAHDEFLKDDNINIGMPTNKHRAARQKRNQVISTLSIAEARKYGLNRSQYGSGLSGSAKDHHIGEISTLRSDGSRYVFGIPAYNNYQHEVTFNTEGRTICPSKGLVQYVPGDNSVSNELGVDNYFSDTKTPGYAHSYLLTAVLSPDYVDYDNIQGPSEGDLGSYTRLNYYKAVGNFKWRTPMDGSARRANYNEGLRSLPEDDKGSYIYGEKEIWYLNTIETKTYIAVFSISDREDGLGVTDEDGTINSASGSRLKKLDKITLYSKPDWNAHGSAATPIKTVHFEYDYSLCPDVPNKISSSNGTGKLTLKKIYFTYGASGKARQTGYTFNYADLDHNGSAEANYSYNPKAADRWGVYIPNTVSSCTVTPAVTDALTPSEYPYTPQNATTAKEYAAAWSLTSIELPSGGTIKIDYESDDYAYVQDKRAAEMFKIIDFRIDPSGGTDPHKALTGLNTGGGISEVIINNGASSGGTNYYAYVQLKNPIPTSDPSPDQTLLRDYFANNLDEIYFRAFVDITNNDDYEYVSGYLDADAVGVCDASSGFYEYAWIKLKRVGIGDRESGGAMVNPICKAAWQFGRLHMPRKVWGQPDPQDGPVRQVIEAVASSFVSISELFKGPNKTIRNKEYGRYIMRNKSWFRLQNPDGCKYGGGSRVKKVAIADNWTSMVTQSGGSATNYPSSLDAQYGQEYEYTTTDPSTGNTISSGVASWEPMLGGDENPFHQPVFFNEEKKLVPDDESYIEKPYGESFYPSPGVGYSRVKVKSLAPSNVTRHGTGYTVQEFYTAKDFPTISRVGWLDVQHWRTNPILSLLRITMKDYVTASQGFVVELNDMHGKQKSVQVFAQGQTDPISTVNYFYKTDPADKKHLNNDVYVIGKDGNVSTAISGMDYDFVADMREQQTNMVSAGADMNLASFLVGIFPAVIPTIIPSWSSEDTRFRSASTTKVINRYGILERTEAHDAGSTVTTENLAWDKETGELLLTKTYTDFDDAVYNFNYPAHWSYDRMGQAYKNVGVKFTGISISSGTASVTNANLYFVKGDEVAIDNGTYFEKAWVCDVTSSTVSLINAQNTALGAPSTGNTLKVLRSGRRNMQAVSVGSVVTRKNPLKDTGGSSDPDILDFTEVLNAGVVEFAEHWSVAPGKTSATQCVCYPNQAGLDLGNMITQLTNAGKLLTTTTLLQSGNYTYGYTPYLNSLRSNPTTMTWIPNVSTNVLTGTLNPSVGGTDCPVTLTLPSGRSWSDVVELSNFIPTSGSCGTDLETFSMTATLNTNPMVQVTVTGSISCMAIGDCSNTTTCGVQAEDVVNPYFHNILGNWRSYRNQVYLTGRTQNTLGTTDLDIRGNGIFSAFSPFWQPNSGNDWTSNATNWTWAQEITKFTPFGNEVENVDALGRYSSAVFGYNNTLPLLVAANSRHQDVGFDGFEDYDFVTADCRELHFSFAGLSGGSRSDTAHTGLKAMKIAGGGSMSMSRTLGNAALSRSSVSCPYTIAAGDLNGVFAPYTAGGTKTYVLNYWVKEKTTAGTAVFNYANAQVKILINGSPVTLTLVQKSPVIEGWQQYQYTFSITGSTSGTIEVKLDNTPGGSNAAWFDDIRIHPYDASMTSYVYHPVNQRLTYQLDENNYATIYEYDEEGALVRVKKETERGIVTLKEARNNSYHKN